MENIDLRRLYFVDLSSPNDPRLAASGLLLAAVRQCPAGPGAQAYDPSQLWWLRLNRTGTTVVAAGPLTDPGTAPMEEQVCRYPILAAGSDGRLEIAYLGRRSDEMGWRLRVATVTIDPATDAPRPLTEPGRVLADDCSPSPLGVSRDGRWICCLRHVVSPEPQLVVGRFALGPEARSPRDVGLAAAGRLAPALRGSHH